MRSLGCAEPNHPASAVLGGVCVRSDAAWVRAAMQCLQAGRPTRGRGGAVVLECITAMFLAPYSLLKGFLHFPSY